MPKRSNEFQRLVAMLTALSSEGATVHESVEVMEIASKASREVDVVAVGTVAGHQSIVCIECRDWKRPQDVQWVEQARTKFDDLGANVRVLVSSSGFTKLALKKAARHNIKTITPGEVTTEFVGKVVNSADRAEYWHWVNLPQKAEVVITRDGVTQQQELPGNVPVFRADGSEISMLEDLVNHVMQSHAGARPVGGGFPHRGGVVRQRQREIHRNWRWAGAEVQRSKGVCQRDLARDRRGRTVRDRECHCHFSGRTNRGRCASYPRRV
jgi:Restriction endonuclease